MSHMSILTHEVLLKPRKCEFNFLFVTHNESLIMPLSRKSVYGQIDKITIVKNVQPCIAVILSSFTMIYPIVPINISIFQYIVTSLRATHVSFSQKLCPLLQSLIE